MVAETVALHTIFELQRATGARVHICRVSSAAGVELVRQAKKDGLPVTADVGIHHVHLVDVDIGYFDPNFRLDPPLRSQRDREAIVAGLVDGTIDAICSDHAPLSVEEKLLPFGEAAPGATGLETLLPLTLKWATENRVPLLAALAKVTRRAAEILGEDTGRLALGAKADVVVFDPDAHWRVTPENLRSAAPSTMGGRAASQARSAGVSRSGAVSAADRPAATRSPRQHDDRAQPSCRIGAKMASQPFTGV